MQRKRRVGSALTLATFFAGGLASDVGAQDTGEVTLNAAQVLDVCTRADMHWIDFCNGYFQGVIDAFQSIDPRFFVDTVCLTPNATRAEIVTNSISVLLELVIRSPDFGNTNGATAVGGALSIAYPCP